MKTATWSIMILGLLGVLLITSCSQEDDTVSVDIKSQVSGHVQNGTWRITKFVDSNIDETANFTGYNFTFNSSGTLNANNGTDNYDGTWRIEDDSSSDDDSQDDLDFYINFNLNNQFEDLSDDWDIISQSATKIELMDISGGDGDIYYLTFEIN